MYTTIDPAQKNTVLATNIVMREREIFQYQINIDNYNTVLLTLPTGEWPAELEKYKGCTAETVADRVPAELLQQVSDLLYRDRISFLLITEGIEQQKSKRIYDAMIAQLPPGQEGIDLVRAAALTMP